MRTRDYRRWQRARHIARRKRICHYSTAQAEVPASAGRTYFDINGQEHPLLYDPGCLVPFEWYRCDGRYNKGKIHCSCYMCRPGKYNGTENPNTYKKRVSWNDEARDCVRVRPDTKMHAQF